jgi:transglutaminase-like putative cysteine protease
VNQTSLENANQTSEETAENLTNTSNPTVSKTVSTSSEPAVYNNTNNTNKTNITYYNVTVKVPYKYWYKAKVKVAHTKYVKQKYRIAYKSYYKTYYKYYGKWYTKYKYTWKYKYTYRWVKKTYYTYTYKWTYKIKYKTETKLTTTKPAEATTNTGDYLSSTNNCQVTDSTIKSMAKSITSGATSYTSKATKIFNWVRDHLAYSFYYNTKYGAVKTLSYRKGNCVDHAHLMNALMRAVGIQSRYVHVSGKFTSGSTYGHVYSEVYVNGKWVKADASSSKNSLGVINSWTLVKYKGTYASLPF